MWPGGNCLRECTGVQLEADLSAGLDRHRMSVRSRGTAYENAKMVCLELVTAVLVGTGCPCGWEATAEVHIHDW